MGILPMHRVRKLEVRQNTQAQNLPNLRTIIRNGPLMTHECHATMHGQDAHATPGPTRVRISPPHPRHNPVHHFEVFLQLSHGHVQRWGDADDFAGEGP